MKSPAADLNVGQHRPVYLWAGPGTIRMNRLKFMNAPVDEAVHMEAHTPVGAARMAGEAAFNWAYLTYDWGFPPEVEQEDWDAFRQAARVYHEAGVRVFGYIQTSNCVYAGSYREKDWYALDPAGRRFYYYTGRYMTCWTHPDWIAHLRDMTRGVIEAGGDGVFYDNPWHASQPIHFGGAWLGPAGCHCPRCREAFRRASGLDIPAQVSPETDPASRTYLQWRAAQATATLAALADEARALKPDVLVSSNDFDCIMRPSYSIYGIDLAALAKVQDVIMIEDYGLPRWDADPAGEKSPRLFNNALTLRTARALVGSTPLSTDPYDKGIGVDPVYPPRRLQQGIAEAAACGAMMVVKGTEYVENRAFTLMTAERFAPQREAVGAMQRWLADHADLYTGGENLAPVALLYPGDRLWQHWDQVAPRYFGTGMVLLAAGVPWRVVTAGDDLAGVQTLFTFGERPAHVPAETRAVDVLSLSGWSAPPPTLLARVGLLKRVVSWLLVDNLYRAYFEKKWARRLGDRLGLVHFFSQSRYFQLPPAPMRLALLDALGERPYPCVTTEVPVLVESWRQGERQQLHLVNYAGEPQRVRVDFGRPMQGQILSPDGPARPFDGDTLDLDLDVYAVLVF